MDLRSILAQSRQSRNSNLDEGIGVYESLKQNRIHREYVTNNEEALRWAIKPGISVAFNPARGQRSQDTWANSGSVRFAKQPMVG